MNNKGIEIVDIGLHDLVPNEGQIEGVPANPRDIKRTAFDKLKKSVEDDPELLSMKPLLVYPLADKYVVIGGNMRLKACKQLKHTTIPAIILPEQTTADKLRRYTLKDNSSYGDWNFDMLSSEWGEMEVADANIIPTEWAAMPEEGLQKDIHESDQDEMMSVPDVIYPSDNVYEIPCMRLDKQPESGLLMPFQAWGVNTRQKKVIGTYHFYVDDYRFDAIWKDPAKIIASGCQSVVEPNFSLFDTTPVAYGLYLIYKKRWLSRWLQEQGVTIWVDLNVSKKFYDYNLLGIPAGYNAFCTRGYADRVADLSAEIAIARRISGKDKPNMIVYGGGHEVQRICEENGLTYCEQYMAQVKAAKDDE